MGMLSHADPVQYAPTLRGPNLLGCVSQIVTLGGRIKGFRSVSRFDGHAFAAIVAEQEPRA